MDAALIEPVRDIARSTLDASIDVVDDAQHRLDVLHHLGRRRRQRRRLLTLAALGLAIVVVVRLRRRDAENRRHHDESIGDAVAGYAAPQPGSGPSGTTSDRSPTDPESVRP